jgi:HTH-type transcriptional regulator, competence development regulator
MLTDFGRIMRTIRKSHNHTMRDTAKLLGVSSAYISAVELGKRDVPEKWVSKIIKSYNLTDFIADRLKEAIYTSNSVTVRFGRVDGIRKQCVKALKDNIETLPEDKMNEILKILNK